MAISVSHATQSQIQENLTDDARIIGPTAWNEPHSVSASFTATEAEDAGLQPLPNVREDDGVIVVDADTDDHILCGAGACAISLPPSADRTEGRGIKIVDYAGDASSGNKVIDADGSETIAGASNYTLNFDHSSIVLFPRKDGAGWYI